LTLLAYWLWYNNNGNGVRNKEFIDYLEKRKGKTSENLIKRRPAKSGDLNVY
jgi:hypothetical protein